MSRTIFIRRPIATSLLHARHRRHGCLGRDPRASRSAIFRTLIFQPLMCPRACPEATRPMASAVASPLERQFTTIAGVEVTSSSSPAANVTLQFALDVTSTGRPSTSQTPIAQAMPLLPAGMPVPPSFRKFNPSEQSIISVGLTLEDHADVEVDDWAENTSRRVARIPASRRWRSPRAEIRRARAGRSRKAAGARHRSQ